MRASHAVFVVDADPAEAEAWVRTNRPDLRVMSAGSVIEIYKETGLRTSSRARSRSRTSGARTRSATRAWRPRAG